MELRDVIVVAVRHWLLLAAGVAIGLAAAVVVVVASTPEYEARAEVVFAARNAADGQDLAFAGEHVQNRMHTYRQMTLSPGVLDGVAAELELDGSHDDLAGRTDIEINQLTTVVGVVVSHPDADAAVREADAVAAAMIEAVSSLENTDTAGAESAVQVTGRVLSEAHRPTAPSSPNVPFLLLAGLLGGLALGTAAVVVAHGLRREPR